MNRDISIYVKDILENMERAERFVEEMTYDEFVKDEMANFAVIRCIEIMGEAAKHIPDTVRDKYPEIHGEISQVCGIELFIHISG